jgi:hypothetical protein
MERRTIIALLGLLAAGVVVADAYTWTDEDGIVHYSDRPQPGATRIILAEPNTGRSPAPRSRATTGGADSDDTSDATPLRYESFEVTSPGAEETLWNIEGVLNVSLSLTPALQPGHQVRVYFDGNPQIVSGTSFQLNEVWRGVHNLQAEVLDETGQMMIRTRTNRFYVQQSTVR